MTRKVSKPSAAVTASLRRAAASKEGSLTRSERSSSQLAGWAGASGEERGWPARLARVCEEKDNVMLLHQLVERLISVNLGQSRAISTQLDVHAAAQRDERLCVRAHSVHLRRADRVARHRDTHHHAARLSARKDAAQLFRGGGRLLGLPADAVLVGEE